MYSCITFGTLADPRPHGRNNEHIKYGQSSMAEPDEHDLFENFELDAAEELAVAIYEQLATLFGSYRGSLR